jgi:DNA-binding MarR family transcriptional regulator
MSTALKPATLRDPQDSKQRLRLWLRMLGCANLIEREVRTRLRTEHNATLPRFDLMAALERSPDGLTMTELSHRLMVSNGNVTGVVNRLEREGLITRTSPPDDRRRSVIALSPAGRRRFDTMAIDHEAWIAELLGGVAAKDVDWLIGQLETVKTAVQVAQGEAR